MQAEPLPGPCPRSTDTRARPSRDGRTSTSTPLQNGSWVHLNRQLGKQGREAGQELAAADRVHSSWQDRRLPVHGLLALVWQLPNAGLQHTNTRQDGTLLGAF